MQVMPIDLTAVLGVIVGGLMVLIPIAGLTARFALKPIVESMQALRSGGSAGPGVDTEALRTRIEALEAQIGAIDENVARILEKTEFDRQLGSGKAD